MTPTITIVNKAFRLCIFEEDRKRLLDKTAWPDSIYVSDWFFKPSGRDNRRQPTTAAAAANEISVIPSVTAQSAIAATQPVNKPSTPAVTIPVNVDAECSVNDGSVTDTMTDHTISASSSSLNHHEPTVVDEQVTISSGNGALDIVRPEMSSPAVGDTSVYEDDTIIAEYDLHGSHHGDN